MKVMSGLETKLRAILRERERVGTLRTLQVPSTEVNSTTPCVDFYSNDYLGLARSPILQQHVRQRKNALIEQQRSNSNATLGSTGSRLISGNSQYFMQVEKQLATFYNSEAALLFNSGYAANVGVLSSLPHEDDFVLYDELVHNSCHEGIRLSRAHAKKQSFSFRHNDVGHLTQLLSRISTQMEHNPKRCVFVVVESLYSMDGDVAPLRELVELCESFHVYLIVDEAHSTAVYGPHGSGLVRALGLEHHTNVLCCRVYTFGKGMGCHGAVVCGSQVLIDFLVNYARSFIYTTAFPLDQLVTIQCAHEFCATGEADRMRAQVLKCVQYFKTQVRASNQIPLQALLDSDSPIQGVVFQGNAQVLQAARAMIAMGIQVIPIRSPTVPKDKERFRIIYGRPTDRLVKGLEAMFQQRTAPPARL